MTTSIEVPYSIAAALPSLAVLDITNDVAHELSRADVRDGIAYISAGPRCLVRVNEREAGFFCDVEEMLARLIPFETADRTRLLSFLLGARTEQVPFSGGQLCLGQWQRVLLFDLQGACKGEWTLTLVG
jgi:thiamine phosphate synthase YjbQ (UPF0047 family)